MGNRSKNFSNSEYRCKCRQRAPHLPPCKEVLVPDELVAVDQDLRDHFNATVTIHSGHRCAPYNAYVHGATASKHIEAIASDVTVDGVSPNRVQEYLLEKYPDRYGIGRYNTFTHIDVRKGKARWDNRR